MLHAAAPRPRLVLAVLVLLGAGALAYAAHVTVGLGGREHEALWNHGVYHALVGGSSLLCLFRAHAIQEDRRAWAAIGVAIAIYWLGDIYWNTFLTDKAHPPYPSWADAGWLGYYIPLYLGMMLLIRARTPRLLASTWLEGVVGALALASVAATLVFDPVVASTHGSFAAVATNLAYPTLDVLLLAFVAAGFALQGSQAGRSWALLGVGLLLAGAADSVYLFQAAQGTYAEGSWINAGWPLSTTVIATAAWAPAPWTRRSPADGDGWAAHALTALFALLIVGLVALETVRRIPLVAHVLLALAIVALLGRLALAGRERRALARTTLEARTDELTGLSNRRRLYEAADQALADGGSAALLLLDLNRFKELNDTLGHNAGDDLLCQVGARLEAALPARCLLARIGGDEFVALLGSEYDEAGAHNAAQALQAALEEPFPLDGFLIPIQASIGVALAPDHAPTRAELLRCADVAMYRAKSRQRVVEVYKAAGDRNTRERLLLGSELQAALEGEELVLHYQPKVSIADRRFLGAEALVRWHHPRLGLLPPGEFVPLAEHQGLIRLLTLAVLDRALAQQRKWRAAGYDVPVAVNLSPANLLDTRLPVDISTLLERHDAVPALLQLEITENTIMLDPERALDVLANVSELGIDFSLDDFGTGYSSLAQLRRLPVRELKIDRSFVMNMTESTEDAHIVRSTIELARSLHLRVVAEGIETAEQLRALQEYGCDTGQGFYLSRPVPAEEIDGWLGQLPVRVERGSATAASIRSAMRRPV